MRIKELKNEIESYGMSTKSYLEKSELVAAVTKARAEGMIPSSVASNKAQEEPAPAAKTASTTTTTTSTSTTTEKSSSSSSAEGTKASTPEGGFGSNLPRETRLQLEIDNCSRLKVGELKTELKALGIRSNTFFEKSEFVRALADARVDGVKPPTEEEEEEVTVAEVEVLSANDPRGPQKRESDAKKVDAAQSQPKQGGGRSPFGGGGGGGSPFGGGGGGGMGGMEDLLKNMGGMGGGGGGMGGMEDLLKNMGGMGGGGGGGGKGGMGGMEDLLKNMGGMGGGGGGGGGMPDMGKVQEMMSNPKVRAVMAKAQTNPKIMKAVTECMSNPAAFIKYQNDPEIKAVVDELKPFL
jgi:hypothetical protein